MEAGEWPVVRTDRALALPLLSLGRRQEQEPRQGIGGGHSPAVPQSRGWGVSAPCPTQPLDLIT
jgi:hypothetical protein